MQIFVQLHVTLTIPGQTEVLKFQQWVPAEVPTPNPPEPLTATAAAKPDTAATIAGQPAPPGPACVSVPGHVPAKLPVEIMVAEHRRKVAACVAQVLLELAKGAGTVRMRNETRDKMARQCPEALAWLTRDHDRKVQGKLAWYRLADKARGLIRVL